MNRWMLIIATFLLCLPMRGELRDSTMVDRMFGFQTQVKSLPDTLTTNIYIKNFYQVQKRNMLMWLIPSMYTIAHGRRSFVSEQYGRFKITGQRHETVEQIYYTTIPRNRGTLSVAAEFLTPNIYKPAIYGDHILSPFNRNNRLYYRYKVKETPDGTRVDFKPRLRRNTQLVRGTAIIDSVSGRINMIDMQGEFDMMAFRTRLVHEKDAPLAPLPKYCLTDVVFKFLGNHITSHFEAVFDCPVTLPDTLRVRGSRHLLDSIRPVTLLAKEQEVYDRYDSLHDARRKAAEADTTKHEDRRQNKLERVGLEIGDNLVTSLRARNERGYVRLSPILNPQYLSYSASSGIAYKIKLYGSYKFNDHYDLYTNPVVGYEFKHHNFYYEIPVTFNYNKAMKGRVKFEWKQDNRISSDALAKEIEAEKDPERPAAYYKDINLFRDHRLRLYNDITPLDWLSLEGGLIYHYRNSMSVKKLRELNKGTHYQSLATALGVKFYPHVKHSPAISINYERAIKVDSKNDDYERWEADGSVKYDLTRMQTLNLRIGGGIYTKKSKNYFLDFSNFRKNNLPGGWEDEWTGDFQLLSSELYNSSKYYVRGNVSFESPLMAASIVPFLGRYVERERIYMNSLSIAQTRFYSELGYSFTCRYFSMAMFASFLNTEFQRFGTKFTLELFRRW